MEVCFTLIKRREVTQIISLCMQRCSIGFQFLFYLHVAALALCLCSCDPPSANPLPLSPVCWNAIQLFNHGSETNQHLFGGRPRPGPLPSRCEHTTRRQLNPSPSRPDVHLHACQRHTSADGRIAGSLCRQ